MVALNDVGDYVVLILVSAAVGAVGGFAAALVPSTSPGVNNPRWLTGAIVGGIAAAAILLVLPSTTTSTANVAGKVMTTTTWSLLKVVPIALVAGWAGPKVLGTLQDRLMAVTKDAQLNATVAVAKSQLDRVATVAHATVGETVDPAAVATVVPAVKTSLAPAVEHGKLAIDIAAGKAGAGPLSEQQIAEAN